VTAISYNSKHNKAGGITNSQWIPRHALHSWVDKKTIKLAGDKSKTEWRDANKNSPSTTGSFKF
jgi:hypothetical protein